MHLCYFTLLRNIDAQFAANFIIALDKYNAKGVCLITRYVRSNF